MDTACFSVCLPNPFLGHHPYQGKVLPTVGQATSKKVGEGGKTY
jgi:hypothetical protein